jgi:hypothetical protein
MPKLNDLSRSLVTLEQDATLIAVIEMGQSSWLVAGIVPGVERQPLKKLAVDESALLKLLNRWREEAQQAGHGIKRHRDMARRQFDVVMAWSVDRLSRSLQDLVSFLSEVHATGTDLFLHQQGVDTSTPTGRAMLQLMGVFAELERACIRERVLSGLARARQRGVRLGRPPVDPRSVSSIMRGLELGERPEEIAERVGLSVRTVNRVRRRLGFPSIRRPVAMVMPGA